MTQMNLSTEQKHTDIKNRLVVAKGEWDVGGKDWEFGISRSKLLGWPKSSLRFFCKRLWKNPNELFGQPNII